MKRTGKPPGRKPVTVRYHDAISQLTWQQFERTVADCYVRQGYRVEHCGTGARGKTDGGVDLVIWRDGRRLLVQCKHEQVYQVPYNPVMQLAALIKGYADEPADGAIFVNSGEFTREAIIRASRFPDLTLIDGAAFRDMLRAAPAAPAPAPQPCELATMAPMQTPDATALATLAVLATPPPTAVGPRTRLPVVTRKRSPAVPRAAALGCLLVGIAGLGFLGVRWRDQGTAATGVDSASSSAPDAPARPETSGAPGHGRAEGPEVSRHDAGGKIRNHAATVAKTRPAVPSPARKPSLRHAEDGAAATDLSSLARAGAGGAGVGAGNNAGAAASVVYRSGNMSEEEFAAWKQRRARGNNDPDSGIVPTAEPADAVHDARRDVSPEAMKVILRTNRP